MPAEEHLPLLNLKPGRPGNSTFESDAPESHPVKATEEDRTVAKKPAPAHRRRASSLRSSGSRVHVKTQQGSFYDDARSFAPGSVPHSMVLAVTIGVVCGVAAWAYYTVLGVSLEFLWKTLPERYASQWPEAWQPLWIPLIGVPMAGLVGLTVRFLGEPGDLPYTVKCVHERAYVSTDHVLPMVLASQFSILAGGSLGPEAPLVAICAALAGFISRTIFRQTSRNLIRKHTLMGMAGALAAFFGVPLGGSLFALEVNSRFGIEYFEHTLEAIFSGEICLAVFRALAHLPIESIWWIAPDKLTVSQPLDIVCGACLGLLGATIAWGFVQGHKLVTAGFRNLSLLPNANAVPRALAGSLVVVTVGCLVPHTLFWGEFEFQTIATLAPSETLLHVWPTSGLMHFELHSLPTALLVGLAKLVAVSFTVAGGYRGGYIFPVFAAGAAFGRAVHFVIPTLPVQTCVLCLAASMNVALTRTAIATTLILAFLSGEPCSIPAVLAASLVSLFATAYMPFIQTQSAREDLDDAIFHDFEPDLPVDDLLDLDISMHTEESTEALTPLTDLRKCSPGSRGCPAEEDDGTTCALDLPES